MAHAGYYLGLSLSWLALRPLLEALGLPSVADAFTWLLLVVVLAGGGRLGVLVHRLTLAPAPACLAVPAVGFGLPAVYRLIARFAPALWPAADAALAFAFVAFGVAVLGFALQSGLLLAYGNTLAHNWPQRGGHRIALAYAVAAVMAVALAWFAVVTG